MDNMTMMFKKILIMGVVVLLFVNANTINAQSSNIQGEQNLNSKKTKLEQLNNASLISAINELRAKIWFTIDDDLDDTSMAFADAKNIQRSLWWSDIFGAALNIVSGTISVISSLLFIKDLSQGLSEVFLIFTIPIETFSALLTLESLQQSGQNLQLAIDGPAYASNVKGMLEKAYKESSTSLFFNYDAYKSTIQRYLEGQDEQSPIIVPHKSNYQNRKNTEVVKGADKVKYAILRRFRDLTKMLSENPLPSDLENQMITQVEGIKSGVIESGMQNTEIDYKTYLRDGANYILVEQKIILGSIAELTKRRINALSNFDKRMEREQIMVINSVASSVGNLIKITIKGPAGETIGGVSKVFILPKIINLSDKVMRTSVYKTNPREEVNMIPQEMLLSLSKELSDIWMMADDIANYIEYYLNKDQQETVIECYDELEAQKLIADVNTGKEPQIEVFDPNNKYQCVDLVKHLRKDLTKPLGILHAYQLYDKAKNLGLDTREEPSKGAVLVWKKTGAMPDGHVAIVTRVNPDSKFDVIEQNWEKNNTGEGVVSLRNIQFDSKKMFGFVYDNPNAIGCIESSAGLATALVIDRSGSMKGEKLEKALAASKAYITTMNPVDMAAVSVFSNSANTEIQMETQDQVMPGLDSALSKIDATNATNIGAGLSQGYNQLQNAATAPNAKVAVLLSDGMNNRGDWRPIVDKFKTQGWPIYTVGFGKDADEATLIKIKELTGGKYWSAETVDVVNVYQVISAHAQNKSVLLSVKEPLAPNGKLNYQVPVSNNAQNLNVFTSWQGSRLRTVLMPPSGGAITEKNLSGSTGRYAEGKVFQMMEVNNPQPGQWTIDVSWAVPPPVAEQVNISVSEKSDIFANILGFKSQYALGEPVIINVQAAEVIGNWDKSPLRNTSITAMVQKPGSEMVRLIQAQNTSWTMYKDVMLDITRNVSLFDDGAHDDYNNSDGIFGNTFTETDKNGAYLLTAIITGEKQNGENVKKIIKGSFQVGTILQNPVTTSQTMQYMEKAQSHLDKIDDTTPYKDETFSDPLKEIDRLKDEDPLDSINNLLKE